MRIVIPPKRVLLFFAALFLAPTCLFAWVCWPGSFTRCNYERIQPGMSREQVAALLGSPGEVIQGVPDIYPRRNVPGAPPGWSGVVWGDTYLHWSEGNRDIYVGMVKGVVANKYFFDLSLP